MDLLHLHIILEDNVDQDALDDLTRQLRDEIVQLDVQSADLGRSGTSPPGAKGDPITVGGIVVALASAGVFTALVELLKSWALRREGRMITIKAESIGQKVELTFSPAETSPEEMTHFVQNILQTLERRPTKQKGQSP